jgi:hypothetical protein
MSARKGPKGPGRLTGAIARVKRVAQLAVPLHKKAYVATASGISAAVYGQASNLVPEREITDLRTAIKACLVKKGKFASPEPLFSCLGLSWRLDPGVHALLGPWKVFAMGVRQGSLSLADLAEMWDESKGTTGPVANAKAGLARAGIEGGIDCWTAGDSVEGPAGDLQLGDRKWVDFLLKAYEVKQLQKLGQRRPVYKG